jgi:hypothetical protein
MWKLALIGWKMLPKKQRRTLIVQAGKQARRHGPTVARAAGRAVRAARAKDPQP